MPSNYKAKANVSNERKALEDMYVAGKKLKLLGTLKWTESKHTLCSLWKLGLIDYNLDILFRINSNTVYSIQVTDYTE